MYYCVKLYINANPKGYKLLYDLNSSKHLSSLVRYRLNNSKHLSSSVSYRNFTNNPPSLKIRVVDH